MCTNKNGEKVHFRLFIYSMPKYLQFAYVNYCSALASGTDCERCYRLLFSSSWFMRNVRDCRVTRWVYSILLVSFRFVVVLFALALRSQRILCGVQWFCSSAHSYGNRLAMQQMQVVRFRINFASSSHFVCLLACAHDICADANIDTSLV